MRLGYGPDVPRLATAVDFHGLWWLDMAMKRVGVAELKDQLSKHLRAVEAGAELEVTDRDRPIARIVPIRAGVSIQPARKPFKAIRTRTYPPAQWEVDSTTLLLQERQER